MTNDLPPDLIRRSWAMEVDGLRRNLARELDEVERTLAVARAALTGEGRADGVALRSLATAAGDASRYGAALDVTERLRFALPDET